MMVVDQTVGAPMVITGFFLAHEIVSSSIDCHSF